MSIHPSELKASSTHSPKWLESIIKAIKENPFALIKKCIDTNYASSIGDSAPRELLSKGADPGIYKQVAELLNTHRQKKDYYEKELAKLSDKELSPSVSAQKQDLQKKIAEHTVAYFDCVHMSYFILAYLKDILSKQIFGQNIIEAAVINFEQAQKIENASTRGAGLFSLIYKNGEARFRAVHSVVLLAKKLPEELTVSNLLSSDCWVIDGLMLQGKDSELACYPAKDIPENLKLFVHTKYVQQWCALNPEEATVSIADHFSSKPKPENEKIRAKL